MHKEIEMQEMFDKMLEHLRTQRKKSVDIKYDDRCMYRSPTGLKCAVGVLISDEDYNRDMEGCSAGALTQLFPDENTRAFLLDCQRKMHDSQDIRLSHLETAAEIVAGDWGLKYARNV